LNFRGGIGTIKYSIQESSTSKLITSNIFIGVRSKSYSYGVLLGQSQADADKSTSISLNARHFQIIERESLVLELLQTL
jgi:hypothetical protein